MSREYDLYLEEHRGNVKKGFDWIKEYLPELIPENDGIDYEYQIGFTHDKSKEESDEYEAYDAYFYGGNRSFQVVQDFEYAWLRHIHRNPHPWQYWVLINDDEGTIGLDIPYNYIMEMILDWWSFSWKTGNLYEIFNWYADHEKIMILNENTKIIVDSILDKMKEILDKQGV